MPDRQDLSRRPRNIDISRSNRQWLRFTFRFFLLLAAVAGVTVLLVVIQISIGRAFGWELMLFPALVLLALIAWIGWLLIVRRGVLTWLRLARAPSRARARGQAAQAERLLAKALARARRFPSHSYRRALMLIELAAYVKHQGRYQEARAFFEEAINILEPRWRRNPMDYFVALNNYAVYLIHLHDYTAAQGIFERVLDLAVFWHKRGGAKRGTAPLLRLLKTLLYLNLVFLFLEMQELDEADDHVELATDVYEKLGRFQRRHIGDYYRSVRSLFLYSRGRFADALAELARARNPNYPMCLAMRARLALVEGEFVQAENLLRSYFAQEEKRGSLRRPELLDHWFDFGNALFGLGKHDEAFAAMKEARAIAADFALPGSRKWHAALSSWRRRAEELGRTTDVASLDIDLQKIATAPTPNICVSSRLRSAAVVPSTDSVDMR